MTQVFRRASLLAVALLLVVANACGTERAAAPSSLATPAASHDLIDGLVGTVTSTLKLTTAKALLRTTPLPQDITVRQTIGREGGVLAIPAAGISVVVPAGALDRETDITMTARAGSLLAYDFAPHGITFKAPLVFNQKLKGTNATLLSATQLKLGYYTDSSLLGKTTALVSEVLSGITNVLTWTFTAPIKHFSGYIIICGFADIE